MSEIEDKINELEKRLDDLVWTQISFQKTVNQIRDEIGVLRALQQKRSWPSDDEVYGQPTSEAAPAPRQETPGEPVPPPTVAEAPRTEPPPASIPYTPP